MKEACAYDKSSVYKFDHCCPECDRKDESKDSKECFICLNLSENKKKLKAMASKISEEVLEALLS